MMWNRTDLKANAREATKRNWIINVLAALVVGLFDGSLYSSASARSNVNVNINQGAGWGIYDPWLREISMMIAAAALVAALAGLLIRIFVSNQFIVGGARYFTRGAEAQGEFGDLAYAFRENYGNVVKTMFLKDLHIFLWTLLFIIPGIIKTYEYQMVPYILADNPHMEPREALALSREMMRGNKWNSFVLGLSFILWDFLSVLTFGIVGVLWVNPYRQATYAELYLALRMPPEIGSGTDEMYGGYGAGTDSFGL